MLAVLSLFIPASCDTFLTWIQSGFSQRARIPGVPRLPRGFWVTDECLDVETRQTALFTLVGCRIWVLPSTMGQLLNWLMYIPEYLWSLDRLLGWLSMSLHRKTCISFDIIRPTSYGESALTLVSQYVKFWLRSFSSK